ncbi:hypothetical protein LguiA_034658 [Lonicera macranthoides]
MKKFGGEEIQCSPRKISHHTIHHGPTSFQCLDGSVKKGSGPSAAWQPKQQQQPLLAVKWDLGLLFAGTSDYNEDQLDVKLRRKQIKFNTMQAIVLDVLLIFHDLLERSFNPRDGFGLDLLMSLDSTVFLFILVCLIYGSSSCLLGQLPRLPIVADAVDRQVL